MTSVGRKPSVNQGLVSFSTEDGSHAPAKSAASEVVARAPTPPLQKLLLTATSGALITFGSIALLGATEITGIVGGLITFAALQAFTR